SSAHPPHLLSFPTRRSSDLNPVTRFCTTELKIRVMRDFARSLGWESWTNVVGLRADEPGRVGRALDPERKRERWTNVCPLAEARSEEHTSELQSRENLVCRL